MNSVLQCIFATGPLVEYFMDKESGFREESKIRKSTISTSYFNLLKEGIRSNNYITPKDLKNSVSRVASRFSGYGQQDAQEFLRFLLDGIHNELNRNKKKPKYMEIKCDDQDFLDQSEIWY